MSGVRSRSGTVTSGVPPRVTRMPVLHGPWPGLVPSTRTAFGPRSRPSTAAENRPDRSTTTAPGRPPATWTRTVLPGGSTRPVNANAGPAAAPIASSLPWPAAVPASGAPAAGRDRSTVPVTRPRSVPVPGSPPSPHPAAAIAVAATATNSTTVDGTGRTIWATPATNQ